MSYISKPTRKPLLADHHRIHRILTDELKMNPSTVRELVLEMDNVLNDRLEALIEYSDSTQQNNDQLKDKVDRIYQEVFGIYGGITWRIVFWMTTIGTPVFLMLLALLDKR
ncbi:hypothetical protein [Chitinophaga qingshengii]|uniref:DUF1640 domain-containing protein n=1 Tax=Chitinophaga qingshengii TaxID=1569794 RepID=A0ABR7TEP2_9BACT|nr:hypothetical protein [Chitinophaga qingshengii]MBC9928745.1 hypothetical protein [Chitinophaga qingshengii]